MKKFQYLRAAAVRRDPLNTSNQTTSLSDAIEFCVGPQEKSRRLPAHGPCLTDRKTPVSI